MIVRKFVFAAAVILSCLVFFPIQDLKAQTDPAPISGTPFLHQQKLELFRELGPQAMGQAERNLREGIQPDVQSQQVNFYAYNFGTLSYYQTLATCQSVSSMGNGSYLNIYVENTQINNSNINSTVINNIRNEFINTIFPKNTTYFGNPPAGDFTILVLDIKDGGGSTFVSGYFDFRNELATTSSNQRHMIYMDCSPGVPGSITFYGTLAHEFQHFIHYNYDPYEETWVEEGLSGLARFVCGYGSQSSHVTAFAQTPSTSLIIWGDQLENYGATYLFMLYLEEHYGGSTLTRNIVANQDRGITGVNSALTAAGYNVTVNDIFKNWVVANYLNNTSISNGIYGYSDAFKDSSGTTISNAPGNLSLSTTETAYPASGSGSVSPYAANYVKFRNLGGTYDTFTLVPYNLNSSNTQSYSYIGRLGSFLLSLTGINSSVGMSGVQEGASNPTPLVIPTLSAENTISTTGGGSDGGGGSGGGGGGGCFIATAAFGSPLEKEVVTLQRFRDRYLLTNSPGRLFVAIYYSLSPPLADWLAGNPRVKAGVRLTLVPVVGLSGAIMEYPVGMKNLGLGLLLIAVLILIRRKKGEKLSARQS